eukprot:m.438797 g.438797  ORF g.438797 m.438797 type:complete len:220 (+) comp56783_c0_seq2:37-696(+)
MSRRSLSSRPAHTPDGGEDNEPASESEQCPVCRWRFLSMDTLSARAQHINSCLDAPQPHVTPTTPQPTKKEHSQPLNLENCPICGLPIESKSTPARISHLKKCAKEYGVDSRDLIQAVNSAVLVPYPASCFTDEARPRVSCLFPPFMHRNELILSIPLSLRGIASLRPQPKMIFKRRKSPWPRSEIMAERPRSLQAHEAKLRSSSLTTTLNSHLHFRRP